jgi:hypothetical protein
MLYKGNFVSEAYPAFFCAGDLEITSPSSDLLKANTSDMKAKITYTGVYRKGLTANVSVVNTSPLTLKMSSGELITMIVTSSTAGSEYHGKYSMNTPYDNGVFKLVAV